ELDVTGTSVLWYDTETSTTPLNGTDLLADGDYWASQTDASGCESASRTVVNVTINKTTPPTTTAANQSFCIKDFLPNTPTIADLSVSGTSIIWYDTETSTTPLNTTDVLISGDYWASQTGANGCESATRLLINVNIINPVVPTTTQTTQSFCLANNPTVANLQATGSTIKWYSSETSTTPLNSTEILTDGIYWAASTDATTGCESISRLSVTVIINDILPATITNVSQTFCASSKPTISSLDVSGNGIVWFDSQTSTTPLLSSDLLVDGKSYWAAQTNTTTGCLSSSRVVVSVTLTDPKAPIIISLGNEFCKIDKPTLSDLNANVTALNGGTITWYNAYPNGSVLNLSDLLVEGETYYAIETDADSCTSLNPLEVTVSLESCDAYDVEIYDGFSPTGNGINDTFKLGNLRDLYPNFKVEFYNRWGNLVYTANAAKPDWNGRLKGDGELVPAGVYYFIIYFNKNDRKPIQRKLYLSR
uniref:gliding motility-associated C-terminal domain-containing protein n=1 Tax=Lutibacter sp. TaxID=1925666 RepID=UPI003569D15B